jgi:hypothetical protein
LELSIARRTRPVAPSNTRKVCSSACNTSTAPSPSKSNTVAPVMFEETSTIGCFHLSRPSWLKTK